MFTKGRGTAIYSLGWVRLLLGDFSTGAGGRSFWFLGLMGLVAVFLLRFLMVGVFAKNGVVYPVTVFGLIMYIYPRAIGLLFFFPSFL